MSTTISIEAARARVIERLAKSELERMRAEEVAREERDEAEARDAKAKAERDAALQSVSAEQESVSARIAEIRAEARDATAALFALFRETESLIARGEELAIRQANIEERSLDYRGQDRLRGECTHYAKAIRPIVIRDSLSDLNIFTRWLDWRAIV